MNLRDPPSGGIDSRLLLGSSRSGPLCFLTVVDQCGRLGSLLYSPYAFFSFSPPPQECLIWLHEDVVDFWFRFLREGWRLCTPGPGSKLPGTRFSGHSFGFRRTLLVVPSFDSYFCFSSSMHNACFNPVVAFIMPLLFIQHGLVDSTLFPRTC